MSTVPKPHVESGVYPFAEIERQWQKRWEEAGLFYSEPARDRPNWVIIELPPFANGNLHLGHVRNYAMGDVSARFRRMAGFNVLYTSGFDSFGLPNELAAWEAKRHPKELAEEVMAEMRRQFVSLGLSHDTRRIIGNHEEHFYGWVQYVFLKLFEQGLAYRQRGPVNWCASCELCLADSLALGGLCWRCGSPVQIRSLDQWLVRETEFAEDLLDTLDSLKHWPTKVKRIHTDWIGKRTGVNARFECIEKPSIRFTIFTAYPALLPCATLIALAPEHSAVSLIEEAGLLAPNIGDRLAALSRSVHAASHPHTVAATQADATEMVLLGVHACHPLTGALIPIAVCTGLDLRSNDGVVVLFPAHLRADARLAALAGVAGEPILHSPVSSADPFEWNDSWLYNDAAGCLTGSTAAEGRNWVTQELQRRNAGDAAVRYRLRDWNIARQRYWGTPIPIIHCPRCGAVPIPENELPVLLPLDVDLQPHGNPLERHATFSKAHCPRCGELARRDTDTLETYCSPWWYHWNCKPLAASNPFDKADARLYMPVDLMIGGEDQTRTCFFHLRVVARALKRAGVVEDDEPIDTLLAIGMVKSNGRKMSKSEGNIVDPRDIIERYGADSLRWAVLAAAAPENDFNWSESLVRQAHAFLNRVWQFCLRNSGGLRFEALLPDHGIDLSYSLSRKLARQLDVATENITEALCQNLFHLAAANLQLLFDRIAAYEEDAVKRRKALDARDHVTLTVALGRFLRMLTPLCPHISEELFAQLGGQNFIAASPWPVPLSDQKERRA